MTYLEGYLTRLLALEKGATGPLTVEYLDSLPRSPSSMCWGLEHILYRQAKRHQQCVDTSMGGYGLFLVKGAYHRCSCPCHPWNADLEQQQNEKETP